MLPRKVHCRGFKPQGRTDESSLPAHQLLLREQRSFTMCFAEYPLLSSPTMTQILGANTWGQIEVLSGTSFILPALHYT